jgi:hypothetical protein
MTFIGKISCTKFIIPQFVISYHDRKKSDVLQACEGIGPELPGK